jgi:hypothetical protein
MDGGIVLHPFRTRKRKEADASAAPLEKLAKNTVRNAVKRT